MRKRKTEEEIGPLNKTLRVPELTLEKASTTSVSAYSVSHRANFCPVPCPGGQPLRLAGPGARASLEKLSESVLARAVFSQQTVVRERW